MKNLALALLMVLLVHTPTISARGDGECNRGGHRGGGSGGGNRGGGDWGGDDWDQNDWDRGNRNSDGVRHDDNNHSQWRGGAFRANLSMAEAEGIMGAPLVEQVRILLTCLENGDGSLHSCRHEINETSACLECEEHAILRAVDEARSDRMEHEGRGGDGKRGGGKGEGDDKPPPPPPVELIVLSVAAALCGLVGFVCGKRAGRAQAQRLSVLNKGAAELVPPTAAPKGVEDAWTKADPEAATRAFPAVLVLEGKKVDTPRNVEHTPVEPMDGKMTA